MSTRTQWMSANSHPQERRRHSESHHYQLKMMSLSQARAIEEAYGSSRCSYGNSLSSYPSHHRLSLAGDSTTGESSHYPRDAFQNTHHHHRLALGRRSYCVHSPTGESSRSPTDAFQNSSQRLSFSESSGHRSTESLQGNRRSHLSSESSFVSDTSSLSSTSTSDTSSTSEDASVVHTKPAASKNWWCNSCRKPREECECVCTIS